MPKKSGKKPTFHWENNQMISDMGHLIFQPNGTNTLQYPDGSSCPMAGEWKNTAENAYMTCYRAKEKEYEAAKENGLFKPVFNTPDWDRQMHDDAMAFVPETPGRYVAMYALNEHVAIPFAKMEEITQAVNDRPYMTEDYNPDTSLMQYTSEQILEQMNTIGKFMVSSNLNSPIVGKTIELLDESDLFLISKDGSHIHSSLELANQKGMDIQVSDLCTGKTELDIEME